MSSSTTIAGVACRTRSRRSPDPDNHGGCAEDANGRNMGAASIRSKGLSPTRHRRAAAKISAWNGRKLSQNVIDSCPTPRPCRLIVRRGRQLDTGWPEDRQLFVDRKLLKLLRGLKNGLQGTRPLLSSGAVQFPDDIPQPYN
jgi:hypothetical protein